MKKIIPVFLFLYLLSLSHQLYAQKEGNIWYFGDYAGLDFNSGSPVALLNSAMSQVEGCASIADANGNLLFYTDGTSVWNSQHQVMPNGTGLLGYWSASQSCIIVPAPGNSSIKYIFTTDAVDNSGINGMNYSVVDMTLNGGLGDVTIKNSFLNGPSTEKLAAVRHANGVDFWVINHDFTGDGFNAYLVNNAGVSALPVVSHTGLNYGGALNSVGQLRFSPNGQRLAVSMYSQSITQLFDFDNSTGIVSNPIDLNSSDTYGMEFSPSGDLLYLARYMGATPGVFQYDLLAGSAVAIDASATLIGNSINSTIASMQLGPDQKIYVALVNWPSNWSYLARIESPDVLGLGCTYQDSAVYLAGKGSFYGLPNIFAGFANQQMPTALFTAPNHICPGTCTDFVNLSSNASSFLWSFPGANPSTSTDVSPTNICYNTPGQYEVQLIATNVNGSDTLILLNFITVYPHPAPQGILQSGDTLFANAGAVGYQWYHNGLLIAGATNYYYVATESGNYNVVATDANGCEVEAVIFDVVASVSSVTGTLDGVTLYPNPASEKLTIHYDDAHGSLSKTLSDFFEISILNLTGEKVMAQEMDIDPYTSSITLDIKSLSAGMYMIEIKTRNAVGMSRFVKE